MSTTLQMTCENGHAATFVLDKVNITSMSSVEISGDDPCPVCGGRLTAAGGRFERNADGLLDRVEERDPEKSVEPPASAVLSPAL